MSLDINLQGREAHGYTHNVTGIWRRLDCYDALYNSHGKQAKEVLIDLAHAVTMGPKMIAQLRKLNPPNGWGDADSALVWLYGVYKEFAEFPDEIIRVDK